MLRKDWETNENVAKDFKMWGCVLGLGEGMVGEEADGRGGVESCWFYVNEFILYLDGKEEQLRGLK